jgi:hypothetical protein
MIIVQLMGGLGNQMFQYAFGRSLEERLQTKIKFDLTFFNNQINNKDIPTRYYELENFNVTISEASLWEINYYKSFGRNRIVRQVFKVRRKYISSGNFYQEPTPAYQQGIEDADKNCYYSGYWHSEKYFNNIKPILADELTLKDNFQIETPLLDKIKKNNSISIHFRRGDYLTASVSKVLSTCALDYYQKAIIYIEQKIKDPYFFIFSDEPAWVEKNLKLKSPFEIVYENQGKNSYLDMILMSHCKHNIIANSSFSWWGAWLNCHEAKIVIAPAKWYNNTSFNTFDLLPDSWIKI